MYFRHKPGLVRSPAGNIIMNALELRPDSSRFAPVRRLQTAGTHRVVHTRHTGKSAPNGI